MKILIRISDIILWPFVSILKLMIIVGSWLFGCLDRTDNIIQKAKEGLNNRIIARWVTRGHWLYIPVALADAETFCRESPACRPNSVFKLSMLLIPEVQDMMAEILKMMPRFNRHPTVRHSWGAIDIANDIEYKLCDYGFADFIKEIRGVARNTLDHTGECVLMNGHSYVKMMEVAYTAYITDIKPTDVVMNLACGNTYWANVFLANRCSKLYTNDNGAHLPIHDQKSRDYNYNEYQEGITDKIEFIEFDASRPSPYSSEMFDKVVSHSSVEHIDNWESNVLPEILRVLKPGGECGLASAFHPLGRENMGLGQSSWWTKKKWDRLVELQGSMGFEIIGDTRYNYGMPWRAGEDTDNYKFGGSVYIVNFIFFRTPTK